MSRRRLAIATMAAPLLALIVVPATTTRAATTASPFDAYIASGDASCVEFTITVGGYSFIVQPDIRLPRATAKVSEGASGALAAPIDPGDSVDALAGLMVPREEQAIPHQITSSIPLPWPAGTDQGLAQAASPINPTLEYPYEHANASYPNPASPGDQQATYLSAPNAAAGDPTGVFSVDGTSGAARAAASSASATAGAGAAVALPLLGISLGRFSSHTVAQVSGSAVTDDVSCTVQDVTVTPPAGGASLHIGSLSATLHTERSLTGSRATSTHAVQLTDATLNGQSLIAPGGGITVPPGVPSTLTFPTTPALCPPAQTQQPCVQPPSLQSMSIAGTSSNDTVSSSGNEDSSTLTAATVTLRTTALVPGSIPPSPNGSPVPASAPVTYTMQLANLDSSAYGFAAPPVPVSTFPALSSSGGGGGGGSTVVVNPGSAGSAGSQPTAASISVPGLPGAIRWPVVALAASLEALILGSLYARRRRMVRTQPTPAPGASRIDLP